MSESDTMFNEQDQRCAAVQLMLPTDPSYDNRTIANSLKMQIQTVQSLRAQLNASDDPLEVVERKATSCHLTSSKSAWKSTPKCTWMCWRVWWSPGAIRWPVADPGRGSRTRRRPTSPKRPRLGFRRSATTLYPSLTAPPPRPEPAGLLHLVIRREHHQHNLPQHQTSLIVAIRRVFAEFPSALMHALSSGSISRRWLRLKAATLNRCQLYYIIKLLELIFSIKVLK